MAEKQLQSVVELEQNRVSIIRTIAVREKTYWNKGKCFCCPKDVAAFAKPLFENADNAGTAASGSCCLSGRMF